VIDNALVPDLPAAERRAAREQAKFLVRSDFWRKSELIVGQAAALSGTGFLASASLSSAATTCFGCW
jgi:hypothetical protein